MDDVMTIHPATVGRFQSRVTNCDGRTKVAMSGTPPKLLALSYKVVAELNFQPRVCPAPMPCIASRTGAVVTIEFDSPRRRWRYECRRVQWEGQDEVDDDTVIAVLMDDTDVTAALA